MLKYARYSVVPNFAALLVVAGCETVPVYHPSESVGCPRIFRRSELVPAFHRM